MGVKKKLSMAFVIAALGAMLIGGGTLALFSAEVTNKGNTFTTGTVDISDITGGPATVKAQIGELFPGTSGIFPVKIKNVGSLKAFVKLDGFEYERVGLFAVDPDDAANGDDYSLKLVSQTGIQILEPGDEVDFIVYYELPEEAGDFYAEKTAKFDIVFKAVQYRNNYDPAKPTVPLSWNEDGKPTP